MNLEFNLIFILKLRKVDHILMPNNLVLIMSKGIEKVSFVISKGWINNFKLNQDTWEADWYLYA